MEIVKKFLSRRLLVLGLSSVVPVVYHLSGISEPVTLAVVGICGTYILGRAYVDKKSLKGTE